MKEKGIFKATKIAWSIIFIVVGFNLALLGGLLLSGLLYEYRISGVQDPLFEFFLIFVFFFSIPLIVGLCLFGLNLWGLIHKTNYVKKAKLEIYDDNVKIQVPKKDITIAYNQIKTITRERNNGLCFWLEDSQKVRVKMLKNVDRIYELINSIKDGKNSNTSVQVSFNLESQGIEDALYKFKKMLDDGLITEAEYEAKKKQILEL